MRRIEGLGLRLSLTLCLACMLCVAAFAEDSGATGATVDISGVTTAFTSGLTSLVPVILTAVGGIAVVGLSIFGAKYAVRFGIGLFKTVTGR